MNNDSQQDYKQDTNNDLGLERKPRQNASRSYNSLIILSGMLCITMALIFNGWMVWQQQQVVQGSESLTVDRVMQKFDEAELATFHQVYQLLKQNYVTELDTSVLVQGAIEGMVTALDDPRSHYFNADQMVLQTDRSSGSYAGIGSTVQSVDGLVTLISIYEDSPAERAGLKNGDQLLAIDGVDAKGMLLDDAVARVKGLPGTIVSLRIQRPGVAEAFDVEVTRAVVETISVDSKMLEDGVGVIEISNFTNTTGSQFKKELNALLQQGMEGLIIDLRNNGGGTLTGLMDVANLVVPEGVIFTWVYRGDEKEHMYSNLKERDFEVVALINGYSASASEVLAGAIQDSSSGVLVGTRSFGKGSAQNTYSLINQGGIALTSSKWLTPSGKHIEGQGLEPDVKIIDPYDPLIIEKDQPLKPAQIELLHAKLQALGYDVSLDNIITDESVAAIKQFQSDSLIYISGALSDDTVMVLNLRCYDEIPHDNDPQMEEAIKQVQQLIRKP